MDKIQHAAQSSIGPLTAGAAAGAATLLDLISNGTGILVSVAALILTVVVIRKKLLETKILKNTIEETQKRKDAGRSCERETDKIK